MIDMKVIDEKIEAAKCEMIAYTIQAMKAHERVEHNIIDPVAPKPYTPLDLLGDVHEALEILGVRMPDEPKSIHELFQEVLIPALKEIEQIIVNLEKLLKARCSH